MAIVIPIVIGLGALFGTVIYINWDKIVIALYGKKIAVLGERAVGKTHLITFLTTGSVPEQYKQTVRPETASERRFQLEKLDLKIKETRDLSGSDAAYAEWKSLFDESDIVLYLLRVDKLMSGDAYAEARVRKDMKHIGAWLAERNPRPQFFIVGTHCDLTDPDFTKLPNNKVGEYADKVSRLPAIEDAVRRGGGGQNAKIILGSMKSLPETEALVYRLFTEVSL
jgi:GTPase SAR1 family protein